jgi:drug/metabolite transporter (DMT)-like permease
VFSSPTSEAPVGDSSSRARFLYLLLAVSAISCSSILVRLTHTPPIVLAFYRQLFSAVILLPFVRGSREIVLSRRDYTLLVLSGLFLAMHFATWITGLFYTTVARATLFVDLQPVWASILGAFFLKEKLSRREIFGVLIVTIGGILSAGLHFSGSSRSTVFGDLLCVAGGIAGAAYLLIGRKVRGEIPWLNYMYSVYYLSALWLLVYYLALFRTFPLPDRGDLFLILGMALLPSILGHGLMNLAIRYFKAFVVNAAFLGEPILATILAYFFFREVPDIYYYFGAVLVFAGLVLILLNQREESAGSEVSP